MATRGRRASPDVPRGVARAQCVARDASRRDSRAHARGDARARGGRSPPPPARTPRRRPRPRVPSSRAADPPSSPRLRYPLPRDARRARDGGCARATRRARGRGYERAPVGRRRHPGGRTPVDERPGRGSLRRGPRPLPRRRRPKPPPTPPTESLLPLLPHLLLPSPYDFRARGPHDVSRRAVTFYWPALLRQPEPRVPGRRARLPPRRRRRARLRPLPRRVAFGVGWNSWTERYDRTLTHLASHGFVVVSPTVADRRPDPASFGVLADHLRACLDWAARETRRSNAPLFGQIDPAPTRTVRSFQRRRRWAARAATDATLAAGPGSAPDPPRRRRGRLLGRRRRRPRRAKRHPRRRRVPGTGQRESHCHAARGGAIGGRDGPRVAAVVAVEGRHAPFPRDEAEPRVRTFISTATLAREGEGVGGWRLLSLARRRCASPGFRWRKRGDSREGPEDQRSRDI